MTTTNTWTKELVQNGAKTAVLVELYTLPFYLTALSSITDTNHNAYKSLLSICIEEIASSYSINSISFGNTTV
ncbi:ferritin-like domain-containing protein [Scytonema sp. UIC 10036]|uniref:ferritin-like domain-containing protein n=1 Tax=Scytonema sp. UIC 10036 TaxID=2304196 RepID=UPI00140F5862|nr:ferritin-like domain-containing protein [Scytonema sp. UIC 10036]